MPFKHSLSALSCALCVMVSPAVFAQAVNFTVVGTVQGATCTPTLVGGSQWGAGTLTLPDVEVNTLDSAGKTASPVPLTFQITNCPVSLNNMWVYFESWDVDGDGRIIPSFGAAADRVRFEILDGNTSMRVHASVVGSSTGSFGVPNANQGTGAAFTGSGAGRGASKTYFFRYYTTQALDASHAGTALWANATYTVKYY